MKIILGSIKETGQKYIVHLMFMLTVMFGGAIAEAWHKYTALPIEMMMSKEQHRKDSVKAHEYILQNNERVSRLELHQQLVDTQIVNIQKRLPKTRNK